MKASILKRLKYFVLAMLTGLFSRGKAFRHMRYISNACRGCQQHWRHTATSNLEDSRRGGTLNQDIRKQLGKLFLSSSPSVPKFLDGTENSVWAPGDNEDEYDDDEADGADAVESPHPEDEEDSSPLLDEYNAWSNSLEKAIQSLEKKRRSLESELSKAQGVEGTVARAQLIVSNLYHFSSPKVRSATVQDWENDGKEVELTLDPRYDSASDEADALFSQARKLKRGSQVVSDLLEKTAEAWDLLNMAKMDLESARIFPDDDGNDVNSESVDKGRFALMQDRLKRTSGITGFQVPKMPDPSSSRKSGYSGGKSGKISQQRRPKPAIGTPASNIRKLTSPGGCTVLVGRNRRGNEHLSLSIARGDDIWMHSRGCPGAHVVIQNRRGGPTPTKACYQFGADLAIFYSDLRSETKAPVSAAEPKHLLKPRGAPLGAIKVRQEWKTFVGRPDQVPQELKEAREESGQVMEYRSIDKAKHRRRTKLATKQDQAKRRKAIKEKKERDEL